jgi:hypothetical protein
VYPFFPILFKGFFIMLCKDLSNEELFVFDLIKASREHGSKLKMETKKAFDREASHFFNHIYI